MKSNLPNWLHRQMRLEVPDQAQSAVCYVKVKGHGEMPIFMHQYILKNADGSPLTKEEILKKIESIKTDVQETVQKELLNKYAFQWTMLYKLLDEKTGFCGRGGHKLDHGNGQKSESSGTNSINAFQLDVSEMDFDVEKAGYDKEKGKLIQDPKYYRELR